MFTVASTTDCPDFSIIVPVLDEEMLVAPFLRHLRQRAPGAEIIIVVAG